MARRNLPRYLQYAKQNITDRLLDGKYPVPTCVVQQDCTALSFSNVGGKKTVTKTHSYLFFNTDIIRTHARESRARARKTCISGHRGHFATHFWNDFLKIHTFAL